MNDSFRIGEVAERCEVSIDTVRYYERRKLLPEAPRTAGGYRLFGPEAIERITFIKQAQELGFTLEEISTLLSADGTSDCRHVHDLLDAKLADLDSRLKALQTFRRKLKHYLDECETELRQRPDSVSCPVAIEIAHRT
ncbi:MAG TPA: heavy metal-responsive transcriptional regulator [Pyrinomonadaceae bacterium]|jgi:DNA-binding transcriptional MerR regulator|nr:MerR family transcriptional regulator [Blastocatellia bacterium]HMQ04339.1 heavy metal-responsive transcriptional regulator [Pyrinomonadaceae bacterium]HQU91776.1 heavy metal-responsive transcriptional regulator [Pyrinomonadaceae bacterium]